MKKNIIVTLIATLAILLTSCGGNSPKDITENFRKSILKADKAAATKVSTSKMKNDIPMVIAFATDDIIKKELSEPLEKIDIQEDTAKIESKSLYFSLKKVDGKWLVDDIQQK